MSLDSILTQIKQKMTAAAGLNAKVRFDFGDDGFIYVDATQSPAEILHGPSGGPEETDVTFVATLETLAGILNGTQDATMAFMMGKLKVKGSMGLAMKLNAVLED